MVKVPKVAATIVVHDPVQEIIDLALAPEPNAIRVSFRTKYTSYPTITVWKGNAPQDMIPVNQLFSFSEGIAAVLSGEKPKATHSIRIDRLPQATNLLVRVDAGVDGEVVVGSAPVTSKEAQTTTLRRNVNITVQSIQVYWGDDRGSGDIDLSFQIYDNITGEPLLQPATGQHYHSGSLDLWDRLNNVFQARIDNAPDVIVPYINITHTNLGLFDGLSTRGTGALTTLPTGDPDSGQDDNYQWNEAFAPLTLATAITDDLDNFGLETNGWAFLADSPAGGAPEPVSFQAIIRIETIVV